MSNQILNCAESLAKEKTFRLNPIAMPHACKRKENDLDMESSEECADASKISKSTTMRWITSTTSATQQNKDNVDVDTESDLEGALIDPYGILAAENENAMLDTSDEHRDCNIEDEIMCNNERNNKSKNKIKLKNAEEKNKRNVIAPQKDKLTLEYDECNANNIPEEMLNKLIQKIKKR